VHRPEADIQGFVAVDVAEPGHDNSGARMNKYTETPHNQIKGWTDILMETFGFKLDGFFIEVGAFDGIQWSPCRPLAVAGWTGIFFEPRYRAWLKLNGNYIDNPKVTCIQKAISNFRGTTTLYIGGSLSTIREDTKELYLTIPELACTGLGDDKVEEVSVNTLDAELMEYGPPGEIDVVSIDVEGSELDVLEGFQISFWQPKMIVAEVREQSNQKEFAVLAGNVNGIMDDFGYKKIYSNHINNIYVK
jgi:FkbM family methyltransferase